VRRALRIGVTLTALSVLLWLLDAPQVWTRLAGLAPGWMALAVALLAGQIVLSALRWRHTAGRLGLHLCRTEAIREYFLAVLANSLLPGGVLGDVARSARARHRAGLGAAVSSVVVERAAGQVALALAAGAGVAAWLWPWPGAWVLAGLGLGAVLAALGLAFGGRVGALLRRVWVDGGAWRVQGGLSLAILGCNLGGFWAAARAVGLTLPWPEAPALLAAALAAMAVPLSVGGWGLREAAAAAIWPLAGIAPEAAVAAGIAFGLAAVLAALPGALFIAGLD
jgi:uncharacterized membrane protein YbhN (UPF0104 family)